MTPPFSRILQRWFQANGRPLPWRQTKDPYHIWLSEIILQQTQVQQGTDYWHRFIQAYPTVHHLATAPTDEVMKLWQGLGYYSRARNLHAAARQIDALGHFPDTYSEVRALPGVGDYTAAAICSIAYQQPHAVVDGNVYRVLSRHYGISQPIDQAPGKHLFATLAQELLDPTHPSQHNQALMDFGALVCTPQSPHCTQCPLSDTCQAYHEGQPTHYPIKARTTRVTDLYFTYIYIRLRARKDRPTQTLLLQRTGRDIWHGLYQPPLIESDAPLGPGQVCDIIWGKEGKEGATLRLLTAGKSHKLSHRHIHADFYLLTADSLPTPLSERLKDYQTIPESTVGDYPVPRLIEELFEQVTQ